MVSRLLCFQSYKSVTWNYVECIKTDKDAVLLVQVFIALSFVIGMPSSCSKIVCFKTICCGKPAGVSFIPFTVNLDHMKRPARFL